MPHPRSGWLSKRPALPGAGMSGSRPAARAGLVLAAAGRGHAAFGTAVGNGRDARTPALARQLLSPELGRPYRFGGIVVPAALPQSVERRGGP
ncbi:MAG: hypothetical protein U1E52_09290 [Geminicoccaceae bacterium]